MTGWRRLASENLSAARSLADYGHVRGSLNRCYYAAYARITAVLHDAGQTIGSATQPNPSHEQLSKMARHNLDKSRYGVGIGALVGDRLKRLRSWRASADYDPESQLTMEEVALALVCVGEIEAALTESTDER